MPGSSPLGCLAPISGALFHPLAEIRTLASKVIAVFDGYKAAKSTVSGLNMFLLLGYDPAVDPTLTLTLTLTPTLTLTRYDTAVDRTLTLPLTLPLTPTLTRYDTAVDARERARAAGSST